MTEVRGAHGDEILREDASEKLDAYWREMDENIARALEAFSYEPCAELRTLEGDLVEEFSERCRRWGTEPPERPVVSYVTPDDALKFKEALGPGFENLHIGPGDGNILPEFRRVILIGDNAASQLSIAKALSHELDHAYAKTTRYGELMKNDNGRADRNVYPTSMTGCRISNQYGIYGAVLDEGYVKHHELLRQEGAFKERYPLLYQQEKEIESRAMAVGAVAPEDIEFISAYSVGSESVVLLSNYTHTTRFVRFIAGELPNGWELIEKTRVTGKYHEFARALEDRFGTGAFRVVMSMPDFSKDAAALARKYLEMPPGEEREEVARKLLVSRPHDADRHERRMKVADINKKA